MALNTYGVFTKNSYDDWSYNIFDLRHLNDQKALVMISFSWLLWFKFCGFPWNVQLGQVVEVGLFPCYLGVVIAAPVECL